MLVQTLSTPDPDELAAGFRRWQLRFQALLSARHGPPRRPAIQHSRRHVGVPLHAGHVVGVPAGLLAGNRRQIAVFRLECTHSRDSLEELEEKRPSKALELQVSSIIAAGVNSVPDYFRHRKPKDTPAQQQPDRRP